MMTTLYVCCIICVFFVVNGTNTFDFTVNTSNITRSIEYPFYGFTFDYWLGNDSAGKWYPNASILLLDLSSPDLIALTKAISPAILRIGGSAQDSIVYDIDGECDQNYGLPGYKCSQVTNDVYYGCINKTRWQQINQFAIDTEIQLLFGVNGCYGRKSNVSNMNISNIANLIDYTNSMDQSKVGIVKRGNKDFESWF